MLTQGRRNTAPVTPHNDYTEVALPVVNVMPHTAKISSLDDLTSFCGWINMLLKQKFCVITCNLNGHRHVMKGIDKHSGVYVRVQYLGYDGHVYVTCDAIELLDIQVRFRMVQE